MSYELAQKYSDHLESKEYKGYPKFLKTMIFANEVQLSNDNIDYYMNIPPRRQEDESYDEMKLRNKFANALLKYRAYLYDYSVYENN